MTDIIKEMERTSALAGTLEAMPVVKAPGTLEVLPTVRDTVEDLRIPEIMARVREDRLKPKARTLYIGPDGVVHTLPSPGAHDRRYFGR
tara:strand:+ start:1344 stop:1610 length:267 start_codon:yes stop_codon:yes gene_type:complete